MNDQALTLFIASKTEIDFILELRYAIRMSCCTQKERNWSGKYELTGELGNGCFTRFVGL